MSYPESQEVRSPRLLFLRRNSTFNSPNSRELAGH
ncbi:hypothetical protein JMJ77_0005653 [Colletotrichum scovillei]|uniref:Uncharacterized protein n=1 Tax=Colletotrichum scovillei TaxID=1209932 RepID=A0A9P7RH56_9PEZI|nr:hypothetical protein JMJ77_0005653 [Colletotrichum scovillei]KAG7076831.1 hypothetical protein JMJ76_0014090 [Colletotrichum scovillei]KAG7083969.1 hypothetical protein JMJ78_0009409 [Colletotrichum scovillei]